MPYRADCRLPRGCSYFDTEMFELVQMLALPRPSIRLDTRLGTHIDNEQSPPPSQDILSAFGRILRQHPYWQVRKQCCGIYNCFGHVWANRRTCIYDANEIRKVLDEDGYRRVSKEAVRSGDVALYLHDDRQEIWHAGIVEMKTLPNTESSVPWVLSKLNDGLAEVFHPFEDVHAPFGHEIQFWTDRE